MIIWVVSVRRKKNVTNTRDLKEKLSKNLKGREKNVIGRQERITDEKSNFGIV